MADGQRENAMPSPTLVMTTALYTIAGFDLSAFAIFNVITATDRSPKDLGISLHGF